MISIDTFKTIEGIAKEFFVKLEMQAVVAVDKIDDTSISVGATLEEPQLYIGEKGQTLSELQYLLRNIIRKKTGEQLYIVLDINDYLKSKDAYLRELANTAADEVALLKREKELPAMSARERRIIHTVVSERQDVISESVGEDPDRRIVIKPRS